VSVSTEDLTKFIKTNVLGESARRSSAKKWLEYYEGDQVKHIPKNPHEDTGHFNARPKFTFNVTRRIIDLKETLYAEDPVRETADQDVRQFWEQVGISERLREIRPARRLCGTVFAFPDYVTPKRAWWKRLSSWLFALPKEGHFVLRTYTPNQVEVMLDPYDPEIPLAVCLISGGVTGDGKSITVTQAWSAEKYWRYEGDKVVDEKDHPFRRIPLVCLRHSPSYLRNFWGRGEGDNIVDDNQEINVMLSSMLWLVKCQSHGQLVAKNAPENWQPELGPDTIVTIYEDPSLEGDVDLKILEPASDAKGVMEVINNLLDVLCMANDVPAGTYRLGINRESGLAITAKQTDIRDERKRNRPTALAEERQLAAMARIVKAGRLNKPLPTDMPEIRINYREPARVLAASEEVQVETHELATGQATVPQLLMRKDPDLTEEEAKARHAANLAYNREHAAAGVESSLAAAPATPAARQTADAILGALNEGGTPGEGEVQNPQPILEPGEDGVA